MSLRSIKSAKPFANNPKQSVAVIRPVLLAPRLQFPEPFRVVTKNFALHLFVNVGPLAHDKGGVHLARAIVVAVIAANHDIVRTKGIRVRELIAVLTSDKNIERFQNIIRQRRSPLRHATLRFVDHPGKPHRTGLDKCPTKLRELKREPAFDQPFTSAGGDETKTHESK